MFRESIAHRAIHQTLSRRLFDGALIPRGRIRCCAAARGLVAAGVLTLLSSGLMHAAFAAEPGRIAETPFYADKTDLLNYLDKEGKTHAVASPGDWKIRRAHILANMQKVTGPLPGAEKKVPLDPKYLDKQDLGKYTRQKLTIAVEAGDRLPGWLLIPKKQNGRLPAMLCLHQTNKIGKDEPAGLGGLAYCHYAVELAERGYVTLAVDYPNFGEYKFDVYNKGYVSATMKGIWNHMRAVDFLQSLPEVDPERIGVIGHSLGGHNSIFAAVFDERLKCVVTSCGFCAFPKYYGGNLTGWSHNGYMPRIKEVYQTNPEKMPFDFTELTAAVAPRGFFTCSPVKDSNFDVQGVKDCITAAAPVYKLLGAEGKLIARYPDAGHEFYPETREEAYSWLDRELKGERE